MTDASVALRPALNEFDLLAGCAQATLDALPSAVYVCDAEGRVVRHNEEAARLWGRRPSDSDRFCGSQALYRLDGSPLPHENCPMADSIRTGQETRNAEVAIERPDGTRIIALVNIRPLSGDAGEVRGAINAFQDVSAQKALETAMARTHRDLEDFFDNSAVGLHIVGRDGTVLRANQAELDLLGYTAEEYIGRHVGDFHADKATIDDILERLVRGEKLDRYPARLRAKDGSVRHVLITSNSRFEEGQFVSTRCFTIDVTNLREAERARRDSDDRLAATYEAAQVGIAEVDESGRYVRVNDALCRILGRSREQLLAGTLFDITHPDDRAREREQYGLQIAGRQPSYTMSKRIVRPDGTVAYVEVSSSSVRDDGGGFRYGVRVMQDVTDSRRMQREIEANEHRLRELLWQLPAAIYTTDAEGRITFFNEAAVSLAGRVPALNSDTWCVTWKLYRPDGTPMPHDQCPMATTLRENRPVRGAEAVAERPDGSRVPFIPYPTPLRDGEGRLVGAINMLVDITDRKEAEARQKVLIDELNHRVKNSLATVQALATQTVKHAADLADFAPTFEARLIALAKAHDLLTKRNWIGAPIAGLLEDILAPYAGEGTLRLVGEPLELNAQAALALTMVIGELATNAAKYGALSRAGGRLTVTWSVSHDAAPGLEFVWAETGGPPVVPPTRRGFGVQLIRRCIERDLEGDIDLNFAADGLQARIRAPLARLGKNDRV